MSNGTPDRPTFETIEAYVLERMSIDEREAFEQRMATDPDLRVEVELEKENIRAVELGGLHRMLKGIAAEEREHGGTGNGWKRYLSYAAILVAIVGATAWWMLRPPLNERLFAEHFVADPGLPVTMGTSADPAFTDAMVHYKEGHYAEAIQGWSALIEHDPGSDTLQYYIGAAQLAKGEFRPAMEHLAPVVRNDSSAFNASARWYLFLAYVGAGDRAGAGTVDLSEDARLHERARSILNAWGQ